MKVRLWLLLMFALLIGCAANAYKTDEFKIGSATSKNLFIDSSQFANRTVRLRFRNSSGDPSIEVARIRSSVESGLRSAGYEIGDQNAGIVLDVNLYFMNSVAVGRKNASNEIGVLLGGVTGYEMAKRPGGLSTGSGVILGAIAGSTLQEVLRSSNEYDTYLVLCDVNIGVIRQESKKKDSFVIGGNRIEKERNEGNGTFESFALRETVKVAVYASEKRARRAYVMEAILDRLSRVVSNFI